MKALTSRYIDTGIGEKERETISAGLAKLLADTYSLALKTQNFHWNVTGSEFAELHKLFEKQYRELLEAVDRIAERIRALGYTSPGSFSDFLQLTSLDEDSDASSSEEMLVSLVCSHEAVARAAREVFERAEVCIDPATTDLMTERIKTHEQSAWMLRSSLPEAS